MGTNSVRNIELFQKYLKEAKEGDEQAIAFLRNLVHKVSMTMPSVLLISLAESVLEFRLKEMKDEASKN